MTSTPTPSNERRREHGTLTLAMSPPPDYEELQPQAVFRHFASMSQVPRPSKHEERIRAWALDTARDLGFDAEEDATGNVIVRVPGTAGHEDAPTVVLQAHLDMVCEKNAGTEHDFDQDPIRLVVEMDKDGAVLRADGTTLGADNGIGVCLALAAAEDPDVVHPPLELLLTVDEEAGMTGAKGLEPEMLEGRILLNLDTEDDGVLTVGCAGGCDSLLSWAVDSEALDSDSLALWRVDVSGLRGGHSGGDIHEGRGAATKLLARTLDRVRAAGHEIRLVSLTGGSKRNAIPREAHAVIAVDPSAAETLTGAATAMTDLARAESPEPNALVAARAIDRADLGGDARVATASDSLRVLRALLALPHGVLGMHPENVTLTEVSNNLGILETRVDGDRMEIGAVCLSRSSSESRLDEVLARIAALADLSGASLEQVNRYPGWEPNFDSPTLAICRHVHRRLFQEEARTEVVHGGLECGLLGQKMPHLDMVSFGPRIEGAHSPDERVWQASVERSWAYLVAILAELASRDAA